jgi:hypothetical protein
MAIAYGLQSQQAWRSDRPVMVHGWIYDLREGLLRDLDLA